MVFVAAQRPCGLVGCWKIGVGIVKSLRHVILIWFLAALCLDLNARWSSAQEKKGLAALEKDMAERPQEAVSIARRASASFADDEKQLYSWAVKRQEKILVELSLAQGIELAEVFEKKLDDAQAGRRVRLNWIKDHAPGLTPDEVRRLLGSPQRNSFQIVYRRQVEQWIYEQPVPISLTFSCTKGQIPRLQAVHSVVPEKS
jgi:hypothetical protein